MTTKKEFLLSCFDRGLDIKEAHKEARKKFGKCTRRSAQIAFKAWEKNNITPAPAKTAQAAEAKPETPKPKPSDIGEASPPSEITSENEAKDPSDLFIETPPAPEPEKPTEQEQTPQTEEQVSQPSQTDMPDVEGMVDQLQGLSVEDLREIVKVTYLYLHEMPARALSLPATPDEIKQITILGKMLGVKYIQDMRHVDLVFWGGILMCELTFWGARVPAAMEKMKELQKKVDEKEKKKA